MGLLNEQYKGELINDWIDVFINEFKKRGFIVTTDLSRIKHEDVYQLAWGFDDKEELLKVTTLREKSPLTNVYISLNAFKLDDNEKVNRRRENLEQIRNIGIDLDFYKLGLSKEYVINSLQDKILKGVIPNPNLLIHSGNGIQLVYGINGGFPPKSTDGRDLTNFVLFISNQLCSYLVDLGVDTTCTSLDSVFRLPHTFNKKEKFQNKKKYVDVEIWNKREFTINELYEYCKPIEHIQTRKRKKVKQYKNGELVKFNENKGFTLRSLNTSKMYDFLKLIQLREGKIDKRNVLTYDYAFCLSLINDDFDYVLKATSDINNMFNVPQHDNELKRTTTNGYKDGQKFWKAYVDNDYSMFGLDRRLIKPKKIETHINEHEITEAEQRELSVLIGKAIKYERNNSRRKREHIENGGLTREEYLNHCEKHSNENLIKVNELLQKGLKQKEIAEKLNLSKGRVSQLVKQIKKV